MNTNDELKQMIEKYNLEMQKLINNARTEIQQVKTETSTEPPTNNQFATPQTELTDDIQPNPQDRGVEQNLPDFENNLPLPPKLSEQRTEIIDNNRITTSDIQADAEGSIVVVATSANSALPINNATVLITEQQPNGEEHLLYTLTTDRNGETKAVLLNTYPASLANDPNFFGKPYKTYNIKTSKDGYYTILAENVPIFADMNSLQPVNMIPLPDGFNGNKTIIIPERQLQTIATDETEDE